MPVPYLGETCALLAPLAWSTALILYRRSDVPALSMNLFKNTLAVGLLTVTLWAMGTEAPLDRPWTDWARLIVSGLLGLSLADTLLFQALKRVGAAGVAVVDTIYAPTVVALSWLVLAETPTAAFLVGAAAVVTGIGIATVRRDELGAATDWGGMAYGFAAIACTATAVILAKPVLERSDLVEVTWTRLVVGVAGQLAWIGWTGQWSVGTVAFRPTAVWRTLIPGAVLGTYVSLMLWLGGFKWADASVAAVLNQMATVYILLQARFVLGETLRREQLVGAGLAAGGAAWIVLTRG